MLNQVQHDGGREIAGRARNDEMPDQVRDDDVRDDVSDYFPFLVRVQVNLYSNEQLQFHESRLPNDFLITPPGIQRWDIDEEDIVQIKDGMAEAGKTPSHSAALLANDSVIVASNSLINAFDRLEVAEFAAKSLILAKPLGKLHPITDAQVEDLRVAFHVGK